ncbi:MAG: ATP-binding protein [Nocardiopsaceae bacterium]|nr:ATP-binding protein [Nocardiopsaceae bacterium]
MPTAPSLARGFVSEVLEGWHLSELASTTELVASELAANVVRAATGPDGKPVYDDEGGLPLLWLRLLSDRDRLMIEVWDNLPTMFGAPVVQQANPDDESGRGLKMVDTLSEDWGWESVDGWDGKRVWAVLNMAASRPNTGEGLAAGE